MTTDHDQIAARFIEKANARDASEERDLQEKQKKAEVELEKARFILQHAEPSFEEMCSTLKAAIDKINANVSASNKIFVEFLHRVVNLQFKGYWLQIQFSLRDGYGRANNIPSPMIDVFEKQDKSRRAWIVPDVKEGNLYWYQKPRVQVSIPVGATAAVASLILQWLEAQSLGGPD